MAFVSAGRASATSAIKKARMRVGPFDVGRNPARGGMFIDGPDPRDNSFFLFFSGAALVVSAKSRVPACRGLLRPKCASAAAPLKNKKKILGWPDLSINMPPLAGFEDVL